MRPTHGEFAKSACIYIQGRGLHAYACTDWHISSQRCASMCAICRRPESRPQRPSLGRYACVMSHWHISTDTLPPLSSPARPSGALCRQCPLPFFLSSSSSSSLRGGERCASVTFRQRNGSEPASEAGSRAVEIWHIDWHISGTLLRSRCAYVPVWGCPAPDC
jgi:hypothetical protein